MPAPPPPPSWPTAADASFPTAPPQPPSLPPPSSSLAAPPREALSATMPLRAQPSPPPPLSNRRSHHLPPAPVARFGRSACILRLLVDPHVLTPDRIVYSSLVEDDGHGAVGCWIDGERGKGTRKTAWLRRPRTSHSVPPSPLRTGSCGRRANKAYKRVQRMKLPSHSIFPCFPRSGIESHRTRGLRTGNPRHHWAHAANVLQLNLRKTSLYKISVKGALNQTGFLKAALLLVDALKKNRVCQKFIRKKTVNTEAKIEENKDLRDRVNCLMGLMPIRRRSANFLQETNCVWCKSKVFVI